MANDMKRIKKLERDVLAIWPDFDMDFTRRGHIKLTLRYLTGDGRIRTKTVFTSGTPSDHRSDRNFLTKVRKTLLTMLQEDDEIAGQTRPERQTRQPPTSDKAP